jgi:hypothetical protein
VPVPVSAIQFCPSICPVLTPAVIALQHDYGPHRPTAAQNPHARRGLVTRAGSRFFAKRASSRAHARHAPYSQRTVSRSCFRRTALCLLTEGQSVANQRAGLLFPPTRTNRDFTKFYIPNIYGNGILLLCIVIVVAAWLAGAGPENLVRARLSPQGFVLINQSMLVRMGAS